MKMNLTPIAAGVAVFLFNAALPAQAQQADEGVQTVVTTGIRASIQQALSKKRNSDTVADVISAEDIGKLPDKNVADAVQRLPGVNISSSASGEGGFSENDRVSIRGTSPSLTQTLIDGHAVGTGDWFVLDQVGSVGRSVSFALLPSEIVSDVVVQKSQQADMVEGGVAGSVNIETRKPLDFKKQFSAELSLQAIYADLPGKTDPQVNGLVSWKNDAKTFGVLAQLFSETRHERRDGQEIYGYAAIDPASNAATAHPDLAGVLAPVGISSSLFEQTRKRKGGAFDLQFKPTSDLSFDVDGFYSKLTAANYNRSYYNNVAGNLNATDALGNPVGVVPTQYTVKNGTLTSVTIPGSAYPAASAVTPYNASLYSAFSDEIYRPGSASSTGYFDVNGSYRASDTLKLSGSAGTTRGTGVTPSDIGYEAGLVGAGVSYQLHGMSPASISFPGTNAAVFGSDWMTASAWGSHVETTDTEKYAKGDADWRLDNGIWESARFGIRYSDHHRNVAFPENRSCAACDQTTSAPRPAWSGQTFPSDFGSGLGASSGFLSNAWQIDPNAVNDWATKYDLVGGPDSENWPSELDVQEKNTAVYAMANIAGDKWRGNFGVRVVRTRQTTVTNVPDTDISDPLLGQTNVNGTYMRQVDTHSYTDVLPSANFKFDLGKDLVARVAVAKTMARPDYSAMVGAVSLNDVTDTGSGGNPNLKPIRSTNYDAALEWYFAPKSLLSADIFYMDMASYVTFGTSRQVYKNNSFKRFDTYTISSPTNISAKNKGIELSYQQALWGGFGVLTNYTYTKGSAADNLDVVGNSKSTYNVEGYYENDRFSTRLAYTYRSSFSAGLYNSFPQYVEGTGNLDGSLNYKINDKLSLTFDALNLNNAVLKYYGQNRDQPTAFYSNGRQFYLGVVMKM